MRRFGLIAGFAVGAAVLVYAVGTAYAGWREFAGHGVVLAVVFSALGVVAALLTTIGVMSSGRGRWLPLGLVAILLLGLSALTPVTLGLFAAPLGLVLLGLSVWKLVSLKTAAGTH